MGCDNFARMTSSGGSVIGCWSICDTNKVIINTTSSCHGYNCCQTAIASDLDAFNTTIEPINVTEPIMEARCKYAFLAEEEWFKTEYPFSNMSTYAPVVLDWGIPNTSLIIPSHIAKANLTRTLSTVVIIVLFQRVTQITQLFHVIAVAALKEIPFFLKDVKVKFFNHSIYLFNSSFLFHVCVNYIVL
jgi:hypothetical protein